jgi:recombination protein RecT
MNTTDPKNVSTTATPEDREKAASLAVQRADVKIQIRDFLLSEQSISRFSSMMSSREARFYISSVLMAVAYSPSLMECSKDSILKCALRAASLELSCDEGLHQAQLVPYKKQAKLIIHYLGLVNLAQRTGKYRTINWGPVKEGMTVDFDILTGLYTITGRPNADNSPTLGYFAYFEMINGYRKSEYMTVAEIHAHAKQWAPSYTNPDSAWNNPKKVPAMEQKTVVRKLMKQADMSGKAGAQLSAALVEDDFVPNDDLVVEAMPAEEKIDPEPAGPSGNAETIPFERPYSPAQLKARLQDLAKRYAENNPSLPENIKQVVAINLGEVFAPAEDFEIRRRVLTFWIFGKEHLADLSPAQLLTLRSWLNPSQDSGGAWHCDGTASREAQAAYKEAEIAKGQLEMPL